VFGVAVTFDDEIEIDASEGFHTTEGCLRRALRHLATTISHSNYSKSALRDMWRHSKSFAWRPQRHLPGTIARAHELMVQSGVSVIGAWRSPYPSGIRGCFQPSSCDAGFESLPRQQNSIQIEQSSAIFRRVCLPEICGDIVLLQARENAWLPAIVWEPHRDSCWMKGSEPLISRPRTTLN